DAREVGRRFITRGPDLQHGLERALARRSPGAVGAGEELGPELPELLPGRAQPLAPFRGLGREELEAEGSLATLRHMFLDDRRERQPRDVYRLSLSNGSARVCTARRCRRRCSGTAPR